MTQIDNIEEQDRSKVVYGDNDKYYQKSPKELLEIFKQSIEKGYSSETAKELLDKKGFNELQEEEKETILEKIIEQFQDTLVRILLFAAFISFVIALTEKSEGISAYIEPFVILLILIANGAIGIIQDINADNALDALKKMQKCDCIVKRDGEYKKIESKYLVPGDIVRLTEGESVPADIQLLEINSITFQIDQSTLTGETEPKYKDTDPIKKDKIVIAEAHNTCFSTSGVTTGSAIGIVLYTGMDTKVGNMQDMIKEAKEKEEKTPLKIKIEEFGDYLTYIIGVICIVVWVINYKNFFDESHGTWFNGCIYYFKISVALAVAAIPEGLPAVITTCLALGTSRLSKHKAIVKKLPSIETLGCTSVICSDKTGTLTTNKMTVTKILVANSNNSFSTNDIYNIKGLSFNPSGEIENFNNNISSVLRQQNECAALNNNSKLYHDDTSDMYSIIGTPTEGALRVLVEKLSKYDSSFKGEQFNKKSPQPYNNYIYNNYEVVYTLEFDRKRKARSVIAIHKETKKAVLFIKGAVEYLIKSAKSIETVNGEVELSSNKKQELTNLITDNFMKKSLRTLALCVKTDLSLLDGIDIRNTKELNNFFKDENKIKEIENNSKLISVVGMLDPPRSEVHSAIGVCHKAGIRVLMITGDERETAKSIGVSIGLIDEESAEESTFYAADFFNNHSVTEQLDILKNRPKLIFSRSEPEHKMILIERLQKLNFIVAMTGDGTNDAAALAKSNIGIAMGIAGTEVTKSAADMVLADDNFATIVKAIEEGRSIYMNMKAFIRYLISSNIGEVVSIFISSMFGLPEAFTSIQLLWVNLVTDGPPATALSFNPTETDIMTKPPRGK